MSEIALKVENLSKLYRLGEVGTGTLSHDLNRWWARMRGKEDPFSKVGEVNDRTSGVNSKNGYVWSLRDVSFDVKRGDVIGIIGKNGAGKSTLLKLISQITAPTAGSIRAKGRIASLLEVGTGMHPEMTGRENIYLNGTILGMRKWEIDRKFDEIVDFAGCAKYVDTPVKRYSSGMKVRLGFAVAAFLEPEILIVDEVLAVGDAEFQSKAIGKMKEVSQGGGRTVLFVSHNIGSVKSLCNKGIVLANGMVSFSGSVDDAVDHYLSSDQRGTGNLTSVKFSPKTDLPLVIKEATLLRNGVKAESTLFDFRDVVGIKIIVECRQSVKNRSVFIHCNDRMGLLFSSFDISSDGNLLNHREAGKYEITAFFNSPIFKRGKYSFDVEILDFKNKSEQIEKEVFNIDIDILSRNPNLQDANYSWAGRCSVEPKWEILKI